jgi:arsenate reductase-like glutaredoxin family protein
MADPTNGDQKARLDRVEGLLEVLANEHIQFHEEHRQLLRAQVLMSDALQKLAQSQTEFEQRLAALATAQTQLAVAQQHTDERMAALIVTVDDLIRRMPLR